MGLKKPVGRKYPFPLPDKLSSTKKDGRSWLRTKANLDTLCYLKDERSNQPVFVSTTLNISGGGLLLSCPHELILDSTVLLYFMLPSKDVIKTAARIAWIEKKEFTVLAGIEFVEISEPDRREILRQISY